MPFSSPAPEGMQPGTPLPKAEIGYLGEPNQVSLSQLVDVLNEPHDYDAVLRNFENHRTSFGDVSGYWPDERSTVLEGSSPRVPVLARAAAQNLLSHLVRPDLTGRDGSWRFLIGADAIVTTHPSESFAQEFNNLFSYFRIPGASPSGIWEMLDHIGRKEEAKRQPAAQHLLVDIISEPTSGVKVGRFLAGRSVELEQIQRYMFGNTLTQAKDIACDTFTTLAAETHLDPVHINRTLRHMQLTDHAAADHLTLTNFADGSYIPGTLRVALRQLPVTANTGAQILTPEQETATHELFHAGAAQVVYQGNYQLTGLDVASGDLRVGAQATEAMTQYQTQYAAGFPGVILNDSGAVRYEGYYANQFGAMHELRLQDERAFNTLFNANYGQPSSDLFRALEAYYVSLEDVYLRENLDEAATNIRRFIDA